MNKYLKYFLLGALFLVVLFYIFKDKKGTIKQELRNFRIEDTASVDRIFLVDKANRSILLDKKGNTWVLNNEYEARPDLVNVLLKTFYRMRVKEPVSNASKETVIKNLAVKSTKVEVYKKGKLLKVFYVGGPTQDSYGTFMIMENSSAPFIIEIPGFRGYLSTRFSTQEKTWRTQRVFNYRYNEVQQVIFENHIDEEQSFILEKAGSEFILYEHATMDKKNITDIVKAKAYFSELKNKNFSQYVTDIPETWKDSILASQAMYTITVKDIEENEKWMNVYLKPAWGKLDGFGEPLDYDPDHFFAELNSGDFVYAQYFVFDPLFRDLDYFTK